MQIIVLQPVLFQPAKEIISLLEKILLEGFNASVVTASPIKDISNQLLDKQRYQRKSNDILQRLSFKYRQSKSTKILALYDFDAYSGSLNLVFGEAYVDRSISVIYLARLRQDFYGSKPGESLFYQRIANEAVHKLGHAFGLNHCENIKYVMHFSNSLSDI
jgi:archaemetzincin